MWRPAQRPAVVGGKIEPGYVTARERIGKLAGELPCAASQVHDFKVWSHANECKQIIKWHGTLGLKLVILVRIPRHNSSPGIKIQINTDLWIGIHSSVFICG